MDTTAVVQNISPESTMEAGVIIAELHQTEKIETVVVSGDFIEFGSSYETGEHTAADGDNEEAKVFGVVTVPEDTALEQSSMEVSMNLIVINRDVKETRSCRISKIFLKYKKNISRE